MAAINAISRTTSERIKAIGFVCALMVVAIHCTLDNGNLCAIIKESICTTY